MKKLIAALAAALVLAGGAGSIYLSQSSFWSAASDFAGSHTGVVSGVMNMACQIGGALTASLTPWIATQFGWHAAFITAAVVALAGAGLGCASILQGPWLTGECPYIASLGCSDQRADGGSDGLGNQSWRARRLVHVDVHEVAGGRGLPLAAEEYAELVGDAAHPEALD